MSMLPPFLTEAIDCSRVAFPATSEIPKFKRSRRKDNRVGLTSAKYQRQNSHKETSPGSKDKTEPGRKQSSKDSEIIVMTEALTNVQTYPQKKPMRREPAATNDGLITTLGGIMSVSITRWTKGILELKGSQGQFDESLEYDDTFCREASAVLRVRGAWQTSRAFLVREGIHIIARR
ncbi:hypothetical protein B0H12DRAFT_1076953 [Mycena haematopus]|nr:hypothetical protein B0H12DRAFT_1076953 [Mycena haematopus]